MKKRTIYVASVAALAVSVLTASTSAEARSHHRHWHHYSHVALYHDYSFGNVQSPTTYIYPAANWGPFFHRVRHYGPIVYQPAAL